MSKTLLTILLISIILLSGCAEVAKETQTQTTPTSEVSSAGKQDQQPTEKVYSIGEDISVDELTYKVTKAESFKEMGTSMFNKKTEGKFVKVYLKITNNAKQTQQMFTPRFKIEDNQGRVYERLSDDMMYIADYLELGKQLQPGLAASGAVVFEMPTDSTNLKLIITGDWLSQDIVKKVVLSAITDIGKDTTQKEKLDKEMAAAQKESEQKVKEMMDKCSEPFKCSSSCPEYRDIGQKDCPSGQLCCME
jgi:hypothetical protein